MKPVLFPIEALGLNVYSSGAFIALGYVSALLLAVWRGRREGLNSETVKDLGLWMLIGGLIGGRLAFAADFWGELIDTWSGIFRLQDGGLILQGAFAGGMLAFWARSKWRAFPIRPMLDLIAPSVGLGMAIGRVGCLLSGCCYGRICPIPGLGLRFPSATVAGLSQCARGLIPTDALVTLPLFPTQIALIIEGLFLFALLTAYYPKRRRDGEVFGILLWAYPISHFIIDIFRDDEGPAYRGLTLNQLGSLLILAIASVYWSGLAKRPLRGPFASEARV